LFVKVKLLFYFKTNKCGKNCGRHFKLLEDMRKNVNKITEKGVLESSIFVVFFIFFIG